MANEKARVWITKYALSGGIFCVDAEIRHDISSDMVTWGERHAQHAHGKEWHRTEGEARARAEKMRKDRIASLNKSIAKLEKLVFSAPFPEGHDGSV